MMKRAVIRRNFQDAGVLGSKPAVDILHQCGAGSPSMHCDLAVALMEHPGYFQHKMHAAGKSSVWLADIEAVSIDEHLPFGLTTESFASSDRSFHRSTQMRIAVHVGVMQRFFKEEQAKWFDRAEHCFGCF